MIDDVTVCPVRLRKRREFKGLSLTPKEISKACWAAHHFMFGCSSKEHRDVDWLPCENSVEWVGAETLLCNQFIAEAQIRKIARRGLLGQRKRNHSDGNDELGGANAQVKS